MTADAAVPAHSTAYRIICEWLGCYMHNGACLNCSALDHADGSVKP